MLPLESADYNMVRGEKGKEKFLTRIIFSHQLVGSSQMVLIMK